MALAIVKSTGCVTGAAMDRPLPKKRPNYLPLSLGGIGLVAAIATAAWLVPRGLNVSESELRIATVQQGMFRDDALVRARAAPLHTIILDALETGRVEEVLVNDGALVNKGDLLFRLSNPQLRLNLVAREAERTQQISNLSNMRVEMETRQSDHQRRLLDLTFALSQARRLHARYASLRPSGYISASTFEDSEDKLSQQEQALTDENARFAIEMRVKRQAIRQMRQAIAQLDSGLQVVNESIEELAVRAPIAGRLTDFQLQVGEIVEPEQHIGRIDDPSRFKLLAEVDEYFLGRVSVGEKGRATADGREYDVAVTRVFPQVTDGRFSIELLFNHAAPMAMSPGESVETRLSLGETTPALILPNDAFLNDGGGAWVFVVSRDGRSAERRTIRIGRRNNSQVEVPGGVAAGERVIVSSYAAFGNARRLQIARQGS
jgi:HlyD family secretion protein